MKMREDTHLVMTQYTGKQLFKWVSITILETPVKFAFTVLHIIILPSVIPAEVMLAEEQQGFNLVASSHCCSC